MAKIPKLRSPVVRIDLRALKGGGLTTHFNIWTCFRLSSWNPEKAYFNCAPSVLSKAKGGKLKKQF